MVTRVNLNAGKPNGNPALAKRVVMGACIVAIAVLSFYTMRSTNEQVKAKAAARQKAQVVSSNTVGSEQVEDYKTRLKETEQRAISDPEKPTAATYPSSPYISVEDAQDRAPGSAGGALSGSTPPPYSYSEHVGNTGTRTGSSASSLYSQGAGSYYPAGRGAQVSGSNVPAPPPVYGGPKVHRTQTDELVKDYEKREYNGAFASNISYSVRGRAEQQNVAANLPGSTGAANLGTSAYAVQKISEERQKQGSQAEVRAQGEKEKEPSRAAVQSIPAGSYVIPEGTVLDAVLKTRLNGDFAGPLTCMVSEPLYDRGHQRILVKQGSVLIGNTRAVSGLGERRLAVTFHRLMRTDGTSINLDKFVGLDQIGQTALSDQINHHYTQIFGVSVALGAIAGFSQANTSSTIGTESGMDQYRQGFSSSVSNSSVRILDRFLNIMPTITIREGTRVKVFIMNDIYVQPEL